MNFPTYEIEDEIKSGGFKYVVGVDEAGRGPGAGPVVAAAVFVPDDAIPILTGKVNDSKKLTATKREALYPIIMESCDVGCVPIEAEIIDEINILEATKMSMIFSIDELPVCDYVIVDGTVDLSNHLHCNFRQVIKGDTVSISIAAASIIAKVTRDRIMLKLHEQCPEYGWDRNKGYLTKQHLEAIEVYGITEFHRKSFRRVGR